jgi:hypothetical protein
MSAEETTAEGNEIISTEISPIRDQEAISSKAILTEDIDAA